MEVAQATIPRLSLPLSLSSPSSVSSSASASSCLPSGHCPWERRGVTGAVADAAAPVSALPASSSPVSPAVSAGSPFSSLLYVSSSAGASPPFVSSCSGDWSPSKCVPARATPRRWHPSLACLVSVALGLAFAGLHSLGSPCTLPSSFVVLSAPTLFPLGAQFLLPAFAGLPLSCGSSRLPFFLSFSSFVSASTQLHLEGAPQPRACRLPPPRGELLRQQETAGSLRPPLRARWSSGRSVANSFSSPLSFLNPTTPPHLSRRIPLAPLPPSAGVSLPSLASSPATAHLSSPSPARSPPVSPVHAFRGASLPFSSSRLWSASSPASEAAFECPRCTVVRHTRPPTVVGDVSLLRPSASESAASKPQTPSPSLSRKASLSCDSSLSSIFISSASPSSTSPTASASSALASSCGPAEARERESLKGHGCAMRDAAGASLRGLIPVRVYAEPELARCLHLAASASRRRVFLPVERLLATLAHHARRARTGPAETGAGKSLPGEGEAERGERAQRGERHAAMDVAVRAQTAGGGPRGRETPEADSCGMSSAPLTLSETLAAMRRVHSWADFYGIPLRLSYRWTERQLRPDAPGSERRTTDGEARAEGEDAGESEESEDEGGAKKVRREGTGEEESSREGAAEAGAQREGHKKGYDREGRSEEAHVLDTDEALQAFLAEAFGPALHAYMKEPLCTHGEGEDAASVSAHTCGTLLKPSEERTSFESPGASAGERDDEAKGKKDDVTNKRNAKEWEPSNEEKDPTPPSTYPVRLLKLKPRPPSDSSQNKVLTFYLMPPPAPHWPPPPVAPFLLPPPRPSAAESFDSASCLPASLYPPVSESFLPAVAASSPAATTSPAASSTGESPFRLLSFYKFVALRSPERLAQILRLLWTPLGILGRTYVAVEGVNGQVAVPVASLAHFFASLRLVPELRHGVAVNFDPWSMTQAEYFCDAETGTDETARREGRRERLAEDLAGTEETRGASEGAGVLKAGMPRAARGESEGAHAAEGGEAGGAETEARRGCGSPESGAVRTGTPPFHDLCIRVRHQVLADGASVPSSPLPVGAGLVPEPSRVSAACEQPAAALARPLPSSSEASAGSHAAGCREEDGESLRGLDWHDCGVELEPHEWEQKLSELLALQREAAAEAGKDLQGSAAGGKPREESGEGEGGAEQRASAAAANAQVAMQSADAGSKKKRKKIILLDCRNKYESDVGFFKGAVPLDTEVFSESFGDKGAIKTILSELNFLPQSTQEIMSPSASPSSRWASPSPASASAGAPGADREGRDTQTSDAREEEAAKEVEVMMYCTGGIRCVKAGAYVKQSLGIPRVFRLKGGVLRYADYLFNLQEKEERENTNRGSPPPSSCAPPSSSPLSSSSSVSAPASSPSSSASPASLTSSHSFSSYSPPPIPSSSASSASASSDSASSDSASPASRAAARASFLDRRSFFLGSLYVFDDRMTRRVTSHLFSPCSSCGAELSAAYANCGNPSCHARVLQCDACARSLCGCCKESCRKAALLRIAKSGTLDTRIAVEADNAEMTHAGERMNKSDDEGAPASCERVATDTAHTASRIPHLGVEKSREQRGDKERAPQAASPDGFLEAESEPQEAEMEMFFAGESEKREKARERRRRVQEKQARARAKFFPTQLRLAVLLEEGERERREQERSEELTAKQQSAGGRELVKKGQAVVAGLEVERESRSVRFNQREREPPSAVDDERGKVNGEDAGAAVEDGSRRADGEMTGPRPTLSSSIPGIGRLGDARFSAAVSAAEPVPGAGDGAGARGELETGGRAGQQGEKDEESREFFHALGDEEKDAEDGRGEGDVFAQLHAEATAASDESPTQGPLLEALLAATERLVWGNDGGDETCTRAETHPGRDREGSRSRGQGRGTQGADDESQRACEKDTAGSQILDVRECRERNEAAPEAGPQGLQLACVKHEEDKSEPPTRHAPGGQCEVSGSAGPQARPSNVCTVDAELQQKETRRSAAAKRHAAPQDGEAVGQNPLRREATPVGARDSGPWWSDGLQQRLLAMLSRLQRPRTILEIGTFTGLSTLSLAEGLPLPRGLPLRGARDHAADGDQRERGRDSDRRRVQPSAEGRRSSVGGHAEQTNLGHAAGQHSSQPDETGMSQTHTSAASPLLVTLERDPRAAQVACAHFALSPYAAYIRLIEGDASAILPLLRRRIEPRIPEGGRRESPALAAAMTHIAAEASTVHGRQRSEGCGREKDARTGDDDGTSGEKREEGNQNEAREEDKAVDGNGEDGRDAGSRSTAAGAAGAGVRGHERDEGDKERRRHARNREEELTENWSRPAHMGDVASSGGGEKGGRACVIDRKNLDGLPVPSGGFDLIFLDASKRKYADFLSHILHPTQPLLAPSGLLLIDNSLFRARRKSLSLFPRRTCRRSEATTPSGRLRSRGDGETPETVEPAQATERGEGDAGRETELRRNGKATQVELTPAAQPTQAAACRLVAGQAKDSAEKETKVDFDRRDWKLRSRDGAQLRTAAGMTEASNEERDAYVDAEKVQGEAPVDERRMRKELKRGSRLEQIEKEMERVRYMLHNDSRVTQTVLPVRDGLSVVTWRQ
ncbi:hypothetical protein BESB_005890 [Besnoitia besnoiti]|uniref:Rhodanese domain-containing protein n=1 Tax=Besnoitia besnoiti TaxID=94643 RepID=A0A2A9MI81_BESBE|nr:hypothetical protein BESB_005890 [Besnoitia besnoiti]PFH38248.1 hypothetical protein BESB_005890 [Besnoitia besnoiti]